eukprot:CAMPEP_0197630208 /NCGR_PEP_ID=MMETSP1338-20131121/7772_1 /TAXON_ID=43686 ORGANISM="Pelagodinium beii, Strain RCC1491" /NCGR_SAMPLE_ID=MMETSP1338 /ASSEMBLY_ACC=CAM_ASM_000754 /LENGTH=253 /DNA_ID=CAMNT_0043201385 /DNA_START=22 /DNA_END=783 /DNA_ORIENTATION=+
MRVFLHSCLALLLQIPLSLVLAEEDAAEEDEELDLSDLDEEEPAGAAGAPVEDFDKDMPEDHRESRMKACFVGTAARLQNGREAVEQIATQIMASNPALQSKEQAVNSIFFTWMMTCYFNIADADVASTLSGNPPTSLGENSLYEPRPDMPQTPQTASKRQWSLLEKVLGDQQKGMDAKQKQQQQQQQPRPTPGATPEAPAESGPAQVLGGILILGGVFGVLAVITMLLIKKDQEAEGKGKQKKEKKEKKKKA